MQEMPLGGGPAEKLEPATNPNIQTGLHSGAAS